MGWRAAHKKLSLACGDVWCSIQWKPCLAQGGELLGDYVSFCTTARPAHRALLAQVRQLSTQRPMRDLEQFAAVSGLPQHLPGPASDSLSEHSSSNASSSSDGSLTAVEFGSSTAASAGSGVSAASEAAAAAQAQQLPCDVRKHHVGEYLYEWRKTGAPTVQLWVSEPGKLSGVVQGSPRWVLRVVRDSLEFCAWILAPRVYWGGVGACGCACAPLCVCECRGIGEPRAGAFVDAFQELGCKACRQVNMP